jgi:CheY-like chemotaxis protein
MSHELRTPITGIMGIAKVLARTDLDETQRDYTGSIEESGRSLLDIVEDLLDFSKLEADRIELSEEDLDPHEIVDRVVRLLGPSAEAQSCSVSVEHGPAVPHRVRGDALRLQQVLRNLLSNAVKFSPGGEVVLRVEAAGEPTDGSVPIRFTVSDTGVGIPDAVLPRVFESFYQVDGSYSKQFKGTGLGLAISKRLVEMMGGEITAESTEGEGSTFCFTVPFLLPVEHVPAEAEEHRTERTAGESHANAMPREEGGLRILVAEDNAINRLYLERFLEAEGHLVSAAADGHAVLEAIAAAEFDLILMDIQMPGLDGMETTRRIRTHSTVPIVALTAYARSDELESFIAAGMNAAVTKPVHEPDLRRVISEIAGGAARD